MREVLSPMEFRVAAAILAAGARDVKSSNVAELCQEAGAWMFQGTIWTIVHRLRELGLLLAVQDKSDRRVRVYTLTHLGRQEIKRARAFYRDLAEFGE